MSTKINLCTRGSELLFYRVSLPLSHQTLSYLSSPIHHHRKAMGSPWRRLTSARQALLVLVHLRKRETLAEVAAHVGVSTAWRYIREAITLLTRRPLPLNQALPAAKGAGYGFVVLEDALVLVGRVTTDQLYYCGKHWHHGVIFRFWLQQ
ncbi:transposase family protein [Streptosporangium saharense]|uniref:transposase family protein n=1 Tax=Streptosporangium saharense TaxID=1706840 RepID=UPI00341C384A